MYAIQWPSLKYSCESLSVGIVGRPAGTAPASLASCMAMLGNWCHMAVGTSAKGEGLVYAAACVGGGAAEYVRGGDSSPCRGAWDWQRKTSADADRGRPIGGSTRLVGQTLRLCCDEASVARRGACAGVCSLWGGASVWLLLIEATSLEPSNGAGPAVERKVLGAAVMPVASAKILRGEIEWAILEGDVNPVNRQTSPGERIPTPQVV